MVDASDRTPYAVGACRKRQVRRAQRIGMAAASRVADGGDVVDIDAKAQVRRFTRVLVCCRHRRSPDPQVRGPYTMRKPALSKLAPGRE